VKGVGAGRVKVGKYPADVSLWAVRTLGRLDPGRLTPRGRDGVLTTLDALVASELDPPARREAQAALARLTAAGLRRSERQP
jgi:hypothetical protein